MIYVDALMRWSGEYHGKDAGQAASVGARNGHRWCHLFATDADSEELHVFARRIGLQRKWFQGDHYDLTPSRRRLAVERGAIQVPRALAVAIWRAQRQPKAKVMP